MGVVIIAILATLLFGALTILLWLARRWNWITDSCLDRAAQITQIVSGVVSVIALAIAIIALGDGGLTTPTPIPTDTPTPPQVASLPPGYTLYDDFTEPSAFDSNWQLWDEEQICVFAIRNGNLAFDCHNQHNQDLRATLVSKKRLKDVMGVSASVIVEKVGGPFQLVMDWVCDEDGSQRSYHLELDIGVVQAMEFFPQESWRMVTLGKVGVAPGVAHLLQIERTDDSIEFSVDGKPLFLDTIPSLPTCFALAQWDLGFYVWKDGRSLTGQIEDVSIKP